MNVWNEVGEEVYIFALGYKTSYVPILFHSFLYLFLIHTNLFLFYLSVKRHFESFLGCNGVLEIVYSVQHVSVSCDYERHSINICMTSLLDSRYIQISYEIPPKGAKNSLWS